MQDLSKRRAAAVIGAALVATVAAIVPTHATEDFAIVRVAGADRFATAANAALEAFPAGADAAVIARGDAFPDALAGSYLTGVLGAPVLLTSPNDLPDATATALDTLGANTVYLLGGTGAISDAVAEEAEGGEAARDVQRVAGENRYATAAEIATGQDAGGIGEVDGEKTALLVSGETFADALAAGPIAHAQQLPILLTPPGSLAPEADAALEELAIEHVVIVGGTAAVSDAVAGSVEDGGATVERVAGASRYATAAAVADFALSTFADTSESGVDLATGERFADALAAGPAGGEANRPLLLTASASLSSEAEGWLSDHAGSLQEGRVFGGSGAVSDAVLQAADAAASGEVGGASEGQLTFADTSANFYRFVPDGADVGATVSYGASDSFTVDGQPATLGGFEGAVTPGDRIRHVPSSSGSAATHSLTNVAATSIAEGTVGNVDVADKQFDFVNPVNGDAVRANVSWTGVLYKVDGVSAAQPNFEADINEGDTLEATGAGGTLTLELTNTEVEGLAAEIVKSANPVSPTTVFKVGALGDKPETSSDSSTDTAGAGNDDKYQADGASSATDTYAVDGASSNYSTFSGGLTDGDLVTYSRAAGVEHYTLVNRSPSLVVGQAVDGLNADGDPNPIPGNAAGGSFTVVDDDGPTAVTYTASGAFVIDGRVANEVEFEAAYSAGDDISFRPADAPSGTTQRVEVTNKTLQGPVGPDTVDTEGDTYGVIGRDGETVLKTVTYVSETASANTYFVNGGAVTLERFELELDAIAAETRSGTAQVQVSGSGDSAVTQHRLTTTGEPITATTTSSTTTTTSGA